MSGYLLGSLVLSTIGRNAAAAPCELAAVSPRLHVASGFQPEPRGCPGTDREDCTLSLEGLSQPPYARYTLRCERAVAPPPPAPEPPPPPPRASPRESPELSALKRTRWVEGASVLVPASPACGEMSTVRRRLRTAYPQLTRQRSQLDESEPRLQVWSLVVAESGVLSVSNGRYPDPRRGPSPGRLSDVVCRNSVDLETESVEPATQIIVATCPGATRPKVEATCPSLVGPVIWSDVKQLVIGNPGDEGVRYLRGLAAVDGEVQELLERAVVLPAPTPRPDPATPPPDPAPVCSDGPHPVPWGALEFVWRGRTAIRETSGKMCDLRAADLDPDGRVLEALARGLGSPDEAAQLANVWATSPRLGAKIAAALSERRGDRGAIGLVRLRELARTAADEERVATLLSRLEAYASERTTLLERVRVSAEGLARTERSLDALEESYEQVSRALEGWRPGAGERLDALRTRRRQIGEVLARPQLDGTLRAAGRGLVLDLIELVGHISDDAVEDLRADVADIGGRVRDRVPSWFEECRLWTEHAQRIIPAGMTVEEAQATPAELAERRAMVADLIRDLDQLPCARLEREIEGLAVRLHNVGVIRQRLDLEEHDPPTQRRADRLVRRADRWLQRARRRVGRPPSGP